VNVPVAAGDARPTKRLIYALGGLAPSHIAQARDNNGQGVAGIREFWL